MAINQILETTDYSLFNYVDANRSVNENHVSKLADAIRKENLLHLNPIIINNKREVIDGQHRLAAAMRLGVAVYYLVDYNITEDSIATLNTNKSNWKPIDYIAYYAKKGNVHYQTLLDFINNRPAIGCSTAINLLSSFQMSLTNMLKNGTYVVDRFAEAVALLDVAKDIVFEQQFDRSFLSALQQCMDSGEYVHETFLEKLKQQPGKLTRMANKDQYVELMEKIYNYRQIVDVVNFRLTKLQREHIKKREERERSAAIAKANRDRKATKSDVVEGKWAKEFLKEEKPPQAPAIEGNKIPVKIDSKTTLYAAPGSDPDEVRKKFLATRGKPIVNPILRRSKRNRLL